MSIRNSKLALIFYQYADQRLTPVLSRYIKNPNHLTLVGAVLGGGVPICFLCHPILGALMMTLSALVDVLDGHFARTQGLASDFGAFWDSSLDRISDFFYLLGFLLLFRSDHHFLSASILICFALTATTLISYVKAKAEALGKRCQSGFLERGSRTIFLIVWAFLVGILPTDAGHILWGGLALYCMLTTITVIQRILEIKSQF